MTTGFSGTDDASLLLPLTISQKNLRDLNHTNGIVLRNLLQEAGITGCGSGAGGIFPLIIELASKGVFGLLWVGKEGSCHNPQTFKQRPPRAH